MNRLEDCKALVVGVNSEIAFAIAQEIAEKGAGHIVGTYLQEHAHRGMGIERVQDEIHGIVPFTAMELDQTRSAEVERVVREARRAMGGLDVLVTAAARQSEKDLFDDDPGETEKQIAVNLTGTLLVIREVGRSMMELARNNKRHRAIGVVTSIRGVEPLITGAYDAAKAGLVHMVKSASARLGPHGISINGIAPGTVDTPLEYARHGCSREEYVGRWALLSPLGGTPVTPALVAEEMWNLLNSGTITGQVTCLDQGFGRLRPLPERGGNE